MPSSPIQSKKIGWIFHLASFLFVLVGIFIWMCAIRAPKFGVDLDGRWGPYRLLMAGSGAVVLLLGLLPWMADLWRRFFYDVWQSHLAGAWHASRTWSRLRAILATVKSWRPLAWWAENPVRSGCISAVFLLALCAVIYFWYATVGYWFDNSKFPSYYQLLADAFRHGQTALLVKPDPALARLENPYENAQREHIQFLWDVSYYKGNYYLYWGPAPVLGQWLLEAILPVPVGDAYLIVFFAVAMLGTIFGLLFSIWRRFFPLIPWGAFAIVLFGIGFSNPILWLVSRSATYEISVVAAQFYLLAGIWAAFPLLLGEPLHPGRSILAGVFWVLAVLSRSTLAIPIIFLTGFCVWRLFIQKDHWFRQAIYLAVPLALGASFLMYYNFVRFDSIFEFGHHYQLGAFNQLEYGDQLFNPVFVPVNLFNYLFNPMNVMPHFPYIEPIHATVSFKGIPFAAPNHFGSQGVSGLLISIPLLLALIPLICRFLAPQVRERISPLLRNLIIALSISAILEFGVVLFFFSCCMRYAMDSIPTLLILAGMGAWSLLEWAKRAPHRVWVPWMLAVLVLCNAAIGLLLGLSGENRVFAHLNPALFAQLSAWFGF